MAYKIAKTQKGSNTQKAEDQNSNVLHSHVSTDA